MTQTQFWTKICSFSSSSAAYSAYSSSGRTLSFFMDDCRYESFHPQWAKRLSNLITHYC